MTTQGILVPLVTPVDEAGAVSVSDVRSMIDFLRQYVDGLVPALSTGEGWLLDDQQWSDMITASVEHSGGLPVYAGALSPTTAGVIEKAARAADLGASAVVATTPYGATVTQQQMSRHYEEICAASPIPVIVYDELEQSGNFLELSTLVGICELPGVVAVKDSQGNQERWSALLDASPDAAVWLGREELIGNVASADGVLLAVANLVPQLCRSWWLSKEPGLAEQIGEVCQERSLFDPDWYVHVKSALRAAGHITHDNPISQVSST